MATFYNGGLMKAHDPRFGINHKYITDKLTKHNWKKRAIVRGGLYIYVNDYQKYDGKKPQKKELVYKIKGLPKKHKCRKDYKNLNWALKVANNISGGTEAKYPQERQPGIRIFTSNHGNGIFTPYNQDLLKKRLRGKK